MKTHKWLALVCGLYAAATLSENAFAADLEPVDYGHDWSGFYMGAHVGYGQVDVNGKYTGTTDEDFIEDDGGLFDLELDGFLVGGQAGFNWQMESIVLGIEGDFSFMDWDDELINDSGELVSAETEFLATLRARLGWAIDRFLIFATAGVAWSDTDYYVNDHTDSTSPDEFGNLDLDDVGLVVGGGAEYAFGDSWSVKAEALFISFDEEEDAAGLTHDSDADDFVELDDAFIIQTGVNFLF